MSIFRNQFVYLATGALALTSVTVLAQQSIRPSGLQAAAAYEPDAALKVEVEQLKAQVAALTKKVDGLEQSGKTIAGKSFELQGKLSKLQADYNKHSHYFNMVSQVGDKQMVSTPNTSPPSENCKKKTEDTGNSWLAKFDCTS